MCGIVGSVWTEPEKAVSLEQLKLMVSVIDHRGPDGAGEYVWQGAMSGVALGHRRLSIIDVSLGQQPMSNEDDTLWVTFNGEIYNYRELRADLIAKGHRFKTESDTEVLLHLYEDEGPEMVHRLRGMFAFAIWDQNRGSLFLARDRFGKKPLIYRREPGRLLFASELKAILQIPGVPRVVNRQSIDQYLAFQYVPHPGSILEGFEKLLPGHWGIWRQGEWQTQRYWLPPFSGSAQENCARENKSGERKAFSSLSQAADQLRETVTEAVRLRLRSDVPLGAFLSGGIDSTVITAVMQRELSQPVETFSIGFAQPEYDERSYARLAAEEIGSRHHEEIVAPSAIEMLPRLIWHYEEPFADSSAIPTMALCEMTSRSVKVALTGDGGDELFAGYDRYQAVQLASRLDRMPGLLKKILSNSLWQKLPGSVSQKGLIRRLKRFQASVALEPRLRYLQWISQFQKNERQALYTPEFASSICPTSAEDWFFQQYDQFPGLDFVSQTTAVDQISYLPGDILTKVDIASMAFGLECRSPFLDQQVGELAASLPLSFKMKNRVGKLVLREAFRDLIPEPILRRKKMGFGVPLDHWFRNELRPMLHDYLLSDRALSRGYFRREVIQQLLSEHEEKKRDHCYRLWSLLVLECWHRLYIDQIPARGVGLL